MHSFIDQIITFSLKNKFFIFFCTAIAIIIGCACFKETPIDAFPDVTNTKVTIITQWPGRSAEEVEKFITIPIEIAMNSVQQKSDIRSTTLFGLSVVNVMFDDKADDFFARQQVYNQLNDADLPEGVTPEVQPLYGPTGEIFRYTLRSEKRNVRELKTLQDWVIDRQLRAVPGVADIVSFGVAPGMMLFISLNTAVGSLASDVYIVGYLPYLAFIIPAFSGLRLAKFNIDERQVSSFIGLPVPAHALFWGASLFTVQPFIPAHAMLFVITSVVVAFLLSLLLVSEVPMFSLKIKSLAWKGNELRYILVACAVIFVSIWGFLGIAGTILLYVLLSIFNGRR